MVPLRVIFMGTPDFAVPPLSEIVAAGHDVLAVYTQPPRPAGRGMVARKSPVQNFAEEAGIPVLTPKTLRSADIQNEFYAHDADVAVVAAYGLILPRPILEAPRFGCLNIHASLLPRWRGAAPIQRAIMAGDPESGVVIMQMDEGLDTGPMCLGERIADRPGHDGGRAARRAVAARRQADRRARWSGWRAGRSVAARSRQRASPMPQRSPRTRSASTGRCPAIEVHNRIRALSPRPGAWFEALLSGRRERIKVLRSVVVPGRGEPGVLLDSN